MTVLETFMSFAKRLPADRLQSVEAALAAVMEIYSDRHEFTASEIETLDRRVADPNPNFAEPEEIAQRLGKPFSA